MKARKILALAGCAALLTLPGMAEVYADPAPAAMQESAVPAGEQAGAADYRTRLASGTFCVTYVRDGEAQRLIAQNGSRLAQTGREGGKKANAIRYKARYKDGNYYQFDYNGSKPFARILPAHMLTSPALNPEEYWEDVPDDVALPEELRIFFADDQFSYRAPSLTAPAYETTKTLTLGSKTYTADVYKSVIRTQANTTAGTILYNALYDGGRLVRIQKVLVIEKNGMSEATVLSSIEIEGISDQIPAGAFSPSFEIPVYEAGTGGMNDLLGSPARVGTIGGKANAK